MNVMLAVGNDLRGDDGAGPYLARRMVHSPLPGWQVEDGGDLPENRLHHIRDLSPQRVLMVDAAEMGLPPGSLRLIPPERIGDLFLLSTHALPLNFLMTMLLEITPRVELLGVQPLHTVFGAALSPQVQEAMEAVYQALKAGEEGWEKLE
jgi:hydrogenase 3 maturation protease